MSGRQGVGRRSDSGNASDVFAVASGAAVWFVNWEII
jgi:hypothetical protein